jgi:hypothetical protein
MQLVLSRYIPSETKSRTIVPYNGFVACVRFDFGEPMAIGHILSGNLSKETEVEQAGFRDALIMSRMEARPLR